jgi:hypothetical protein
MRWKNRQLSKLPVSCLLLAIITIGCSKTEDSINTGLLPVVTTRGLDSILMVTAVCSGTINDDKGIGIKTVGICWNTEDNPTIENKKSHLSRLIAFLAVNLLGFLQIPGTM